MTREEAITNIVLIRLVFINNVTQEQREIIEKTFDMAIKALEHIDKIEQIISIDNTVIQEDVLKYKMICEVLT